MRAHPAAADAAQSSAVGTVAVPRAQEAVVGMPTRVQKVVAERQQVAVPREAAAVEEAASKSGSWTERRRDALQGCHQFQSVVRCRRWAGIPLHPLETRLLLSKQELETRLSAHGCLSQQAVLIRLEKNILQRPKLSGDSPFAGKPCQLLTW